MSTSQLLTTSTFSSYFSKKDNKYDISVLIISFITFCALSTFCGILFIINFTGWFIITLIGGIGGLFSGEKKSTKNFEYQNMLDHHRFRFSEDFSLSSLSSSLPSKKDGLPSIPSYRSSSNKKQSNSILPFDFSLYGLTGNNKSNKNKKDIPTLAPSEYCIKRSEKRAKNSKCNRHIPEIPSQLNPNRQKEEWKSNVDYYPSERHSHQPKSKLSVSGKMIESTAAYRVGKKCNGWINGESDVYAIRQKDSLTDCTSFIPYGDPFYSNEPIKDKNIRLDQERPKIIKQERKTYNESPAGSLQYAREYLTIFLTVKKEMNL